MTYSTEFPAFPASEMPLLPAGWVDRSWCNDACPFFVHEASGMGIWIDRLDTSEREYDSVSRFIVVQMTRHPEHGWVHDADEVLFESEDFAEVLGFIVSPVERLMDGTATLEDCDKLAREEMAVQRACPEMLAAIARRRAELAQQS